MKFNESSTPPPAMLSLRAVRALASLVCAALFGTVLFAVSLTVSQPAAAAITGSWASPITVRPGQTTSVTIGVSSTSSVLHTHCSVPTTTTRFTIAITDCTLRITPKSGAAAGCDTVSRSAEETNHFITGGFRNFGNGQICLAQAANLAFTAPTGLEVGTNRTQTINALDYVTETDPIYTISCGDATNIDTTELNTVVRTATGTGCIFTVTPKNVQGSASFTVPYTSTGGGTVNGAIPIEVGPPSTITYQAPAGLSVKSDVTLVVDASPYASDGDYTISCGDAKNIDTTELETVTRDSTGNGCMFTVTPKNVQGAASFTVPFTSSGGHTLDGGIGLQVEQPTIMFTAPDTNPAVQISGQLTIDLSNYATAGDSAITCGTVTESSALISIFSQSGCSLFVAGGASTGTAVLTVPYMTAAGNSLSVSLSVDVIPASDITFNAPMGLIVGGNRVRVIDASDYVTETHSSFTITCGNARNIDTVEIRSVTREGCMFTVTPRAIEGSASFDVLYRSSGGDIETGTIAIEVGPASAVLFDDPNLFLANSPVTSTVDASTYVMENSAYTVTCGAVTRFDSREISSVAAAASPPGNCNYTITLTGTTGAGWFDIPYTSSGGHSVVGRVSVTVTSSNIRFTAPSVTPAVATSGSVTIDAADFVVENRPFTITCGTATSVSSSITSISRTGCQYTVNAGSSADASASFTVPYSSSAGTSANGTIPVNIGQSSSITYTAPTGLKVGAGNTKTFDLSSAAVDGGYGITCGAASSISALLTTVANTGCDFTVTAGSTQGTATFTVRFTSAGTDTHDGTVSVEVGAASALAFSAPALTLGESGVRTFDLSSSATDGSYAVSCGEASNVDNTRLFSVTRRFLRSDGTFDAAGCQFRVAARDARGAATFDVPFVSEASDTPVTGTVTVVLGAVSDIQLSVVPAAYPPTLPAQMPAIAKLDRGDCLGRFTLSSGITANTFECYALVDLQNHWATEENRNLAFDHPLRTWGLGSTQIDLWDGVELGTDGRVVGLNFGSWGVRGTLPEDFGRGLPRLKNLSLNDNYLTGEMPYSINSLATVDLAATREIENGNLLRFNFCGNYFRGALPALLSDARSKALVQTDSFAASQVFAEGAIPCQLRGSPPDAVLRSSDWSYARVGTEAEKRVRVWSAGVGISGDLYPFNPIQLWDGTEWTDLTEHTCVSVSPIDQACLRTRETTVPAGSTIRWRNGYYQSAVLAPLNLTNVSLTPGLGSAQQGSTIRFNASRYASDGSYRVVCSEDYVEDFAFISVEQSGENNCIFELEVDADADISEESFYAYLEMGYVSEGGDEAPLSFYFFITESSNIAFTPPEDLPTEDGLIVTLDASVYSPLGASTQTCSEPAGVDASKITVVRQGCNFTVTATAGATPAQSTSFKVYYYARDNRAGIAEFTFNIAATTMTLASPAGLTIAAGQTKEIDVGKYASDSRYSIRCDTAIVADSSRLAISQVSFTNSCSYRITASASAAAGATSFTVPYRSSGGGSENEVVSITIGQASDIVFTPPSGLARGTSETITIDALDYVSDTGGYAIGCREATDISGGLSTVLRGRDCDFSIQLGEAQGTVQVTIPYISAGGDTEQGTILMRIGPESRITFNDPGTFSLGRNRTLVINALDYAIEASGHIIACAPATEVDSTKLAVTRDGCTFTIDPVDTLGTGAQGDTTFKIPYTTGGARTTGDFTVNIGPDSTITYAAPVGLERGSNYRTYTIDASSYATEVNPSNYTISCGDATGIDIAEIASVSRAANSCRYTIALTGTQGPTSFAVPYTSTGGHAVNGIVSFNVGPASSIAFSATAGLSIGSGLNRTFDMSDYASDGSYTITCGTITTASSLITLGTQNGCEIAITSGSSTGTAMVTVPYTSSGGASLAQTIRIAAAASSDIQFNAPADLKVGINRTRTINALDYASDGGYTITCSAATAVDTDKLTSVVHDGSCGYTITPVSTLTSSQQGSASFTVPYTSAGSDTLNAVFSIEVGPASTITFDAPSDLTVAKNRTLTIDASEYATEANPDDYAITCADATSIDTTEIQSVTRNGCSFTVYPKNVEGPANFTVSYTSEGGHALDGTIQITVGPDSSIVFTPPANLAVRPAGFLTIDALEYITENAAYTVTCAAATNTFRLTIASRNGCEYRIEASDTPGTASFAVAYTSTGGDTQQGTITLTIAASTRRPTTRPTAREPEPEEIIEPEPRPRPETTTDEDADVTPGWNTFTTQTGTATAAAIRTELDLPANTDIYAWNTRTQAWTPITNPAAAIPAGTTISLRNTQGLSTEQIETASLGRSTQRISLTSGWNVINAPADLERVAGENFLTSSSLTDCGDLFGVIAITTYNNRTRRWHLHLPCHPRAETRLTTGDNPPFDPLTAITQGQTAYIYTRSRIPLEAAWNPDTQTFRPTG